MPLPAPAPLAAVLGLCACPAGHPAQAARLAEAAGQIRDWTDLPAQAEAHGLTPLAHRHLRAAGVALPPGVAAALQAGALLHAHAAQVRTTALGEILAAYHTAGIPVLVLKGAALAYLVYDPPALRPMRDLDLLVPAEAAPRAQALLADLGFRGAATPLALEPDHHHTAAVYRVEAGHQVTVEVHHALDLHEPGRPPHSFADFAPAAQAFAVGTVPAQALGPAAMLWHIYRHALAAPLTYEPVRLIWLADLIGAATAWHDRLDWEQMRQEYPALLQWLAALDILVPWPEPLAAHLAAEAARIPAPITPPAPPTLPAVLEMRRRDDLLADAASRAAHLGFELADLRAALAQAAQAQAESAMYSARLEATVTAKNAHIADLEARLKASQAGGGIARRLRLPWARR